MDEELRGLAFTSLQALMVDFPEWREDVLSGFVYFIMREVTDVHPTLLDNSVKMLLQLISQWRQVAQSNNRGHDVQVDPSYECLHHTFFQRTHTVNDSFLTRACLHRVRPAAIPFLWSAHCLVCSTWWKVWPWWCSAAAALPRAGWVSMS